MDKTIITNKSTDTYHQTIENGLMVNISDQARGVGFSVPVAISMEVWDKYIGADRVGYDKTKESIRLRLKMILIALAISIQKNHKRTVINFKLFSRPEYGILLKTKFVLLKAKVARDDGERVLTIMLPREG